MSSQKPGLVVLTIAYHSHQALKSLSKDLSLQTEPPEKWIVINNSPDSSGPVHLNASFPISVITGVEGAGFSEGCNRGFDELLSQGWEGWVWLLNPDIHLTDQSTINRLKLAIDSLPSPAVIGTAVLDPDGNLEKSAGWIDPGLNFRSRRVNNETIKSKKEEPVFLDWVSGCSMLLKPSAHKTKVRFEKLLPLYYEDMDLCLRLSRQCSPVLWLPWISVRHNKGKGSRTSCARRIRLSTSSYIRFLQRHRPGFVLVLRTLRILINASIRFPLQPLRSCAVMRGCLEAYFYPLT